MMPIWPLGNHLLDTMRLTKGLSATPRTVHHPVAMGHYINRPQRHKLWCTVSHCSFLPRLARQEVECPRTTFGQLLEACPLGHVSDGSGDLHLGLGYRTLRLLS